MALVLPKEQQLTEMQAAWEKEAGASSNSPSEK
jgi:hypothetical protein